MRQVPPLSQQPVHEVPSHTQLPDEQCWPAPHAGPVPHWQVPDEVQPSLTFGSQLVQEHTPATHFCPGAHVAPPHVGPACA